MHSDRIYIASPFFNFEELNTVISIESILKENDIDFFSPRSFGILKNMSKKEREIESNKIFDKNIEELNKCNKMIAVIDNYDAGTMIEIGYFFALNKKIVTYSPNKYGLNVMLAKMSDFHSTSLLDLINGLNQKNNILEVGT